MKKIILAVVLSLALPLSAAAGGVAATVNGVVISDALAQLEFATDPATRFHQPTGERLAELKRAVLERLIERELLFAEAKRRNVVPTEKQIDESAAEAAPKVGGQDNLNRYLKENGITADQHRDWTRKNLAAQAVKRGVSDSIRVTPDEAQAYYGSHITEYVKPASAHVGVLYFPVAPFMATSAVAAIEAAAGDATRGWRANPVTDPAQLARQLNARFQDLKTVHAGSAVEGLDEAIFTLKPGEISAPIRTVYGWNVVKVSERDEQRQMLFPEVRESIEKRLKTERAEKAWLELLSGLKAKATIQRSY